MAKTCFGLRVAAAAAAVAVLLNVVEAARLLMKDTPTANEWASVRGVNYVVSTATNSVQMWIEYDPRLVERELDLATAPVRFNAVRVFIHAYPWLVGGDARKVFLSNVEHFCAAAAARKLKPLVVLFDDDFIEVAKTATEALAYVRSGAWKGAGWMTSPGTGLITEDATKSPDAKPSGVSYPLWEAFATDVLAAARRGGPLLGVDLMNEPHQLPNVTAPFIARMQYVVESTTGLPTTADSFCDADFCRGIPKGLERVETGVTYHTYWHYHQNLDCLKANASSEVAAHHEQMAEQGKELAAASGKTDLMVTEFGMAGCYCYAARALTKVGVGWILWGLVVGFPGAWQSMYYSNGTAVISADEIKCLEELE